MKPAAFTSALLLMLGTAAHSQWSILPQAGIDNLQSSLRVDGTKALSALSANTSFKAALRTDYRFKGGHGPYASIGSSPSAIGLRFNTPTDLLSTYSKVTDDLQWRLEGGYGLSTKPIYFGKGAAKKTAKATETRSTTVIKKSCGSYSSSYYSQRSKAPKKLSKPGGLNMRLQPSIGVAYLPGTKETIAQENNAYVYRAANWNTALVSSMGFELAKGTRRFMTLQFSYTKGIGNLGTETLSTITDGKTVATSLRSTASSWAVTAGVPIQLTKRAAPRTIKSETPKIETQKCRSYYKRCTRTVI
jgi:hypothetical protein